MKSLITLPALLALSLLPAPASLPTPVSLNLSSSDKARIGQPSTIVATLIAGDDLNQITFEVPNQPGWHVLDGTSRWTGAMKKGERMEFSFRVIPLNTLPEPVAAMATAMHMPPMVATIDAAMMNGERPWFSSVDAEPQPEMPSEEEMEAARRRALESGSGKDKASARGAAVQFRVTGRLVYADEEGIDRPLRRAKVQLINRAMDTLDPLEQMCSESLTDDNGNFDDSASCDDVLHGPDVAVRVVLDNTRVRVKPDGALNPGNDPTYTFQINSTRDFGGGTINLGQRRITGSTNFVKAFHLHNLLTRANRFMVTEANETIPKVTALFPSAITIYMRLDAGGVKLNEIRFKDNVPFVNDAVAFHEYGHHILFNESEFPFPDYVNGQCDKAMVTIGLLQILEPGHCRWEPELGVISFSEGWPNYFAAMVFFKHRDEDGLTAGIGTRQQTETRPDFTAPDQFEFVGQEDKVEGFITSILWDLNDEVDDDQEEQGDGRRDNINFTFAELWSVIKEFDPAPNDASHNHPVSIHEFWSGLKSLFPDRINEVSEVYREHRILKPQPDLQVTTLQNPPTALARGASFSISTTVTNVNAASDDETAVSASTLRFRLQTTGAVPLFFNLGTRQVPGNLGVGAGNTALTTLTIPTNLFPGTYRLVACADFNRAVPERDETNNCTVSTGTIQIQ